ncbi:hypothetical protein [Clostridium gasigenes]|uniref:Uncharacterized protein n=1 Tax=Clostridium gasigenes TaxID=94869 RepID=A0A1H0TJT1_9CLOT|nr:hypothetical protein [Clostridium gasigenes]MBB6624594.1 hypothetical protein [Clostridium gasigenes]SDP54081.1 hypothetical protein SAMN04488529_10777 [Clostridium gasigenes]
MWKMIIKNNKVNLSMCIIFFILGYLNLIINNKMCRFFQLNNIVIAFIPFLVASILLMIFYKKEIRTITMIIINTIVISLSIILLIINFGKLIVSETFDRNTDVKNYPRIRKLYSDNEMQYFPSEIPKDAENIEFEEWAAFMQGGSGLYLSYDIDSENEEKIDEELRGKSKYVLESIEEIKIAGENICVLADSEISEAIDYKSYPESSDKFIIYISEARKASGDGYWNHGVQYGVIINKDKHRIIYFHEYW